MIPFPFFQEAGTGVGVDENDGEYQDDFRGRALSRADSPADSQWDSDEEPGFPGEIEQGYIVIKHDVAAKVKAGDITPMILTHENARKTSVVLMSNSTQVTVRICKCTPSTSANESEPIRYISLTKRICETLSHNVSSLKRVCARIDWGDNMQIDHLLGVIDEGSHMLHIRKYVTVEGSRFPTRMGVCMTPLEFRKLLEFIEVIIPLMFDPEPICLV